MTTALLTVPVLSASPAQAYPSQQWALDYLKANQVWQVSRGTNVTVAVIDSGVASIPDLSGQVLSGADFANGPTSGGDGRTDTDGDGHGTGMASVISGNGANVEGLAPAAKILPVRVDAGGKGTIFASNVAAGIRYATQAHVGVINLSIGGNVDFGPEVQQAISQAIAANIVVVAAAGNDSTTSVDFPAAYPGVVAVGAVDQSSQLWAQSNSGGQVALAAPGVQVYRDNNFGQQGTSSGTSEATAYVSATAALIRSAHPDWTAGQVIRDLISTADPGQGQSAGQRSDQYGYGIIDPLKALRASAPSDTSNPLLGSSGSSPSAAASTGSGSTTGDASSALAAASSSSSSHTGLIIGVLVGVIVVVGLILLVVALARRGRGGPKPPSGPGQYGGGYPPQQQSPYQQQGPYQQYPHQQQSPYQQPPYQQQPPQDPPYPQAPRQ